MNPRSLIALVIGFIFVFSVTFYIARRPKMILFYSNTCPHCQIVAEFIKTNNIQDKLRFRELEVSSSPNNQSLLMAKAKSCGLDTGQGLSVPFFFDGRNCLIGDTDIINWLKNKTK